MDPSIIGSNDDKVIEMSQQEKDVLDQARADTIEEAKKKAIEAGNISMNQLLEALEDLNIITKKQITDEVKENEGISLSP